MRSDYGEPLNLGQDRLITINELADLVAADRRRPDRQEARRRGRRACADATPTIPAFARCSAWEPARSRSRRVSRSTYAWIEEQVVARLAAGGATRWCVRSSSALTEPAVTSPKTCTVLGVEYFIGDLRTATAVVLHRARSGGGGYSCLCGVHGIVTAQHSATMMRALDAAWLNFPDGAPVAWLMRRFGARGARRVAGPDLMPLVFEAGQDAGLRHFLFGSTPDVLERLQARLLERYPRALIVGTARRRSGRCPTGERRDRPADHRLGRGRRLGRPGTAQAGPVARAQRRPVPAGARPRRRRRLRLPRGHQAARAPVDAGRGARVAAPAGIRAAPARAQVRGHEHRVRRPGRPRGRPGVRPHRAAPQRDRRPRPRNPAVGRRDDRCSLP